MLFTDRKRQLGRLLNGIFTDRKRHQAVYSMLFTDRKRDQVDSSVVYLLTENVTRLTVQCCLLTGNVNYHQQWNKASMGTDYNHAAIHYGTRWDKVHKRTHEGE